MAEAENNTPSDGTATLFQSTIPAPIRRHRDEWGNEWLTIPIRPGIALGLSAFLLSLFFFGMSFMSAIYAWRGQWLGLPLAAGFILLGVLLSLVCFTFRGSYNLRFGPDELLIVRRYPLFSRQNTVPLAYIERGTYRLTAGIGPFLYYNVYVEMDDGATMKVAAAIRNEQATLWLVDQIGTHIRRESTERKR